MSWSNGLAEWVEGDTAYLSVVFTWRLPEVYSRIVWYRSQGLRVRVGGPAIWSHRAYAKNLSGIAEIGGEADALVHHNSQATIASRGCPVGCYFCIVPKMEGKTFTLIPDFVPRPILCDNNLSALPVEYQNHIIRRYQETETPLLDANSGFEPKTFDADTYTRWKVINRGAWRFALDEMRELEDVRRMMGILKDVPPSKKRVYVLIGNEPIQSCYERIMKVIEWGGEPYCQPLLRLNTLDRNDYWVRYDWTPTKLQDMARWVNRWLWRKVKIWEYAGRKNESPIFADIETTSISL